MIIFIYYFTFLINFINSTNTNDDSLVTIKFKNDIIVNLPISNGIFEVFKFFKQKILNWEDQYTFDLQEFEFLTFEAIFNIFRGVNLDNFNEKLLIKILVLVDYLCLDEEIYPDESSFFWNSLINKTQNFADTSIINLELDFIISLINYDEILKTMFKKYLQNIYKKSQIIFRDDLVEINNGFEIKPNPSIITIEKYQNGLFENRNFCNKTTYFFTRILNLSRIFYFSIFDSLTITIIESFDLEKKEIIMNTLSYTIEIIKNNYNPEELLLGNVLYDEPELELSNLDSLTNLSIYNSSMTNLKLIIKDLNNIRTISLSQIYSTFDTLVQISKCKLIDRLVIENSVIINDEDLKFDMSADMNIKSICIEKSAIPKSFFKWYLHLKNNNNLNLVDVIFQENTQLEL